MSQVTLNASMRSNLLSLQKTQGLMDTTQERLSTGKKVNSALDNPSAYYTAQSLNNRAGDLSALLDSMGQGIQTIKAANEGIEAITTFVQQAKALANSAKDDALKEVVSTGEYAQGTGTSDMTLDGKTLAIDISGASVTDVADSINEKIAADTDLKGRFEAEADADKGTITIKSLTAEEADVSFDAAGIKLSGTVGNEARLKYSDQFDGVLSQIDQLAKDSGYKGINLLQENNLTVIFNEDRSSNLEVKGVDGSSKGLGIAAAGNWGSMTDINKSISEAETAVNTLRSWSSEFGNNYSIVQNREDFTENLVNVLTEGADKLTLADMNEESANMLALQTRQQLAINSLSLASQAAQSVLKLF